MHGPIYVGQLPDLSALPSSTYSWRRGPAAPTTRATGAGSGSVTGSTAAPTRHVNDRLFVLRDGTWTDIRFERSLKVVEVEAFSPAYFELVRRLPALAPYLALGDRVLVAGDGLAVKVGPGGRTEWQASDLRRVVRAFANAASG